MTTWIRCNQCQQESSLYTPDHCPHCGSKDVTPKVYYRGGSSVEVRMPGAMPWEAPTTKNTQESWEEEFDEGKNFVWPNGNTNWDAVRKFISQVRQDAVNEWIREHKPIIGFSCSVHKQSVAHCLQCSQEEITCAKEEGALAAIAYINGEGPNPLPTQEGKGHSVDVNGTCNLGCC